MIEKAQECYDVIAIDTEVPNVSLDPFDSRSHRHAFRSRVNGGDLPAELVRGKSELTVPGGQVEKATWWDLSQQISEYVDARVVGASGVI
jgi:hypothetical protein